MVTAGILVDLGYNIIGFIICGHQEASINMRGIEIAFEHVLGTTSVYIICRHHGGAINVLDI